MSNIINKLTQEIENIIQEDVNKLGFDLEFVECVNELDNSILRVVIDKTDGNLEINDCEKTSREIEDKIDVLMKKDKKYILEVSSAGLEKQLKTLKLYKKYVGHDICVKLFKKTDVLKDVKLKEFEANLVSVDDKNNKIKLKKNIENINVIFDLNIDDIASAHTVFDYDKMFKENKKKGGI